MEINFQAYDYGSFDFKGNNYVRIIGRDDKGRRVCVIDSFHSYFYVILKPGVSENKINKLQEKIKKLEISLPSRTTKVVKTELKEKNFLGRKVKAIKIFITNYKDAHTIADLLDDKEIEARREYDLNYITKYIIERKLAPLTWHKITGKILTNEFGVNNLDVDLCIKAEKIERLPKEDFNPKVLAFDIEADEFEIGKGEILMISLVSRNFKKVLTWKSKSKEDFVEYYKNEAEMLEAFVNYVKKVSPDLLVGYFSDGFDLPYLRSRARKLGIKLALGLDNSQPIFARSRISSGYILGIVHVDLFRFIEAVYSQYLQSETLSLNEVASELLGESKLDFNHKHSSKIKKEEWKDYFKYNLQDSLLTYKLAEKFKPDMLEFCKIIQEPLFNITRTSMSGLVESYILHNLDKFNEIAEKRPIHDEIEKRRRRKKYEGAFVFQPQANLYENLAIFDFTSMYASIIVSYNLSLSTFLGEEKRRDSFEIEVGEKKYYFSKKPGFFPLMLSELIKLRKKYKQELKENPSPIKKARSNAYKLLANASYGYQGFFGARYYCLEAAAATAALARKFIKEMIEKTNSKGYKVIYADTDGFAFLLGKKSKKETLEFLEELNSNLPGIMELELEDFYKRGLWVTKRTGTFGAKKKYALINWEGKMKIRGFETVRRDWCSLAREVQNKVLEKILKDGSEIRALKYVKEIIKKIKRREIDKQQLIIKTQLKKPLSEYKSEGPHVTVARKMLSLDLPVNAGMLIQYYIAESKNKKALVRERARLPEEEGNYDINYYINNQILPAVENIFEVFDVNIKEIIASKEQKKLDSF